MFKHVGFNPNKHRNKKQTKHKHTYSYIHSLHIHTYQIITKLVLIQLLLLYKKTFLRFQKIILTIKPINLNLTFILCLSLHLI